MQLKSTLRGWAKNFLSDHFLLYSPAFYRASQTGKNFEITQGYLLNFSRFGGIFFDGHGGGLR
jgi:hypothetical protein